MKKFAQWKKEHPSDAEILSRCRQAVDQIEPDAQIILYGSRARGDHHRQSDYDLVIIITEQNTKKQRMHSGTPFMTLKSKSLS